MTLFQQDLSWQEKAECVTRNIDPDLFFTDQGGRINPTVKAACAACPVAQECLEYGLHEPIGIWGGMGEGRRKKIRRERRLEAARNADNSTNGHGPSREQSDPSATNTDVRTRPMALLPESRNGHGYTIPPAYDWMRQGYKNGSLSNTSPEGPSAVGSVLPRPDDADGLAEPASRVRVRKSVLHNERG